jgi:hypothetical protein
VWRIRDDQAQVTYSVAGQSGGMIRIIHVEETRSAGFSGLASKLVVTVCQGFGIKTTATVSWFEPQIQGQRFGDLRLKIIATIS